MKSITLLTSLILVLHCGFSQNGNSNSAENSYVNFFEMNPETIYTHVNKSKFLSTETLWFKSYIYDIKTQQPYLSTANVYAATYDSDGVLIDKKLLYAIDGMAQGEFNLSEYFPGTYYLKVFTNYMRNFNDSHQSLLSFEILGENPSKPKTKTTNQQYDFQLLPEGGQLLNQVTNSIGFKTLNYEGKGVVIESGKVLDSKNQVVTTFKSNGLGMGKFSLFLNENETYSVEVKLEDGSIINKKLPQANQKGVVISVNNLNPKNLFISIQTNEHTLSELLTKPYFLFIHRDGLIKKIDVNFNEGQYDYIIAVPKSDLLSGINILTVFNDKNQPIVERIIYNSSKSPIANIDLVNTFKGGDSTKIKLRTKLKDSIVNNISISVLPASTKAYPLGQNIISKFLLKPYIEGTIENTLHYFKKNDRQANYDLDLLLLTQGWSKYSWNKIFNSPPKELYHFDAGMQIKGKVSNRGKNDEIVFFHKESNTMLTSKISSDDYFSFENILIADSTRVYFSLKDKKGNLSKAHVYTNVYPNYKEDTIPISNLEIKKYFYDDDKVYENLIFENTTTLDTVTIQTSKKRDSKNKIIYGRFNTKKIELENVYDDVTLITDIISANGFDVYNSPRGIEIAARRGVGYSFTGRAASPNIYIDNQLMNEAQMIILMNLMVKDVDELFISRTPSPGTTGVAGGLGGNINIYTKKSFSNKYIEKQSSFSSKFIEFGYSLPQKYTSPFYNKSLHQSFADYGVLNWVPNLTNNDNGDFEFKIPNYSFDDVNLYIEGMSVNGDLISKIITVPSN
ncbi:hypothetical protein [Hanstruepera ponticola]|uniref:hypothetical protein n=1 Tax=Hanstruepera ponticola TaxID=2042995 RepID=UPI00177C5249|nr:hypothetical protein [Hanstruepera ponticola]